MYCIFYLVDFDPFLFFFFFRLNRHKHATVLRKLGFKIKYIQAILFLHNSLCGNSKNSNSYLILKYLSSTGKRLFLKTKFQTEWMLPHKNCVVVFTSLLGITPLFSTHGNVKSSLCNFPLIKQLHFLSGKTAVSNILYLNIEMKNVNRPNLCKTRDC